MYKEFYMNAMLHNNVPGNVINLLKLMTGDMEINNVSIPQDALFKVENWQYILQSESSRFDSICKSSVDFSFIDDCYFLRVSCSLNNDKMQIEKFLGLRQRLKNLFKAIHIVLTKITKLGKLIKLK